MSVTGGQLSTPRKQTKHPGVSSAGWCQERSCAGSRSSDRVRPWARRNDTWIIEDDYLSELQLKGRAAPALASLDHGGRVLHIGSFSKTISPALRLGFMVVPPELSRRFGELAASLAPAPAAGMQRAVAEFLREGHYLRHLRRMERLYAARRQALLRCLSEIAPTSRRVQPTAGLAVSICLPNSS